MAKARISEAAALEKIRRESVDGGEAVVDMRIDVVVGDESLISVGGRWDRRAEEYIGDAETAIVVYPHAGQVESLQWFLPWLCVHAGRRDNPPKIDEQALADLENRIVDLTEVFSVLFAGGRRGGKTWIGALICALYAVQFPGAIVWILNPSASKHDEVRRYMGQLLAPSWIARETVADGWELINGSAIMLKSAYAGTDADAIKEGEAHLIWMNEGQKMTKRVYTVGRGAIADHSGLVVVCANPPVEATDQEWVTDFAADALERRRAAAYFHFNPLDNPHVNGVALLSMRHEIDIRTFRIEVLGEFLPPADRVCYNWNRTNLGNERARPEPIWTGGHQEPCPRTGLLDVTEIFLREEEQGDGFADLIGLDFQVHPHMGGPVYRFYCPPDKDPNRKNVLVWGVSEVVVEGDEDEWAAAALEAGYDPDTTLIVGDATGEYQHSRRANADSPPPEWSGKGSFDILRMAGYKHIVPPSRRIRKKNPDIIDRIRSLTSMVENAKGVRRYFLDPDHCPKTAKSLREWPTVHGKPSRIAEAAHLGDAASYPMIRLFPRILRSGNTPGMDPIAKRLDRVPLDLERPKGFSRQAERPGGGRRRESRRRERGL